MAMHKDSGRELVIGAGGVGVGVEVAAAEWGEREAEIGRAVDRFYEAGRADPLLGPVFARRVTDWGAHLATMRRFWIAVVYRTGGYSGRPIEVHARIEEIGVEHFARWLELWEAAVGETVRSEAGGVMIEMGRRMGKAMAGRLGVERDGDSES